MVSGGIALDLAMSSMMRGAMSSMEEVYRKAGSRE
jgi:hypothetical protein